MRDSIAVASQVKLVFVGHVDHGKSTLIGRLLYDSNALPEGKYQQLVDVAARRGVPFEFANLMDSLQAERDQNVTIDTAQIWFRNDSHSYVFIDAPGHREFLKNMITGAASADGAVLVIDAQEGLQEQSRRHGYLLGLLGVRQLVVLVNKMDLVDYAEPVFRNREREHRAFLDSLGLVPKHVIPVAAKSGDNIAKRSSRLAWFDGPTFADSLHDFSAPADSVDRPLRFSIQDVYKFDHRRILGGRIESGTLNVGDPLLFFPGARPTRVKTIERWNGNQQRGVAGDSIGVTLTDPLYVERGAVATGVNDAVLNVCQFRAKVFWLGREALRIGRKYVLKLATQEQECEVVSIDRVLDAGSLETLVIDGRVPQFCVAELTIRTRVPIVCDNYDAVPALGRFVLVDGWDISGGGIVFGGKYGEAHAQSASRNLTRTYSQVAIEERHARTGHKGAVVWFTGLSGSGKSTLATRLERELFDRGMQAFVLDGDNLRHGLSANLGFSAADRAENIRRVAEVAKLFAEAGLVAITAFISPYRSDRLRARQIASEGGLAIPFLEVHLDTPLEVCEQRDPKQLYKKARAGAIKEFTGITAPYEPPDHAELTIATAERTVEQSVVEILDVLQRAIK